MDVDTHQMDRVIVLQTTHHVLQVEEWLKQERIPHVLVPKPPNERAGCGLAIRFERIWEKPILQVLKKHTIRPEGIYVYEAGQLAQKLYP